MEQRVQIINECFSRDKSVTINKNFELKNQTIEGVISVKEEGVELPFIVEIFPAYPRQFHDHETIRFINKELIEFNHVNYDGSICVHTYHSPDLSEKILFDINSLKVWIRRYYINKEKDEHYEHIVISDVEVQGVRSFFLFTDVNYTFSRYEYGVVEYSLLSRNNNDKKSYNTYFIQCFNTRCKKICCEWSKAYQHFEKLHAVFIFIEKPPVKFKRFAITNWKELEPFVSVSFLSYLYKEKRKYEGRENEISYLPVLIGYSIEANKIHWQTVLIKTNDFPVRIQKVLGTNRRSELFTDKEMNWTQTHNASYEYFFGRGVLHKKLTHQNVLIIGVGAIGSIVAITLARGGAKKLTLIDHDIKEAENVCRSEYSFDRGTDSKVNELRNRLFKISPFVEVQVSEILFDYLKLFNNEIEAMESLMKYLNEFDIIIDCSTDYDVVSILDKLNLNAEILSLSLTNHARELICTVNPNIYRWNIEINNQLKRENEDLYNPTGCWSPTFKASYNDVNTLVQYAIKQINTCYMNDLSVRNFYLSTDFKQGLTIKLNQF